MKGKNKIKILMVIRSLKFGSGTENACVKLGDLLNQDKLYEVSYFSFYKDKFTYNHTSTQFFLGKKPKFLFGKIWYSFIGAIKLVKLCKKENIAIIIAYMGSGILATLLSKIFGNKSKAYIYLHRCLRDFPRLIIRLLIYFSKKYSEKIIVLTNYEKDYLVRNFNLKKDFVCVIPNFIDEDETRKLCLEPIDLNKNVFENDKFTFVTVGRLEKIKNQKLMIQTFKKLNEKYFDIQLIILGDGKEKENLQRIANKNIHFLGNQENIFKFLCKSDCFLLTSRSESFSIAILEAMACNLPIISTKTQGPNELLDNGKYGILVDHNEKSIYSAMEKVLLDRNLRANYKHKSKERVKTYQKEKIMEKWEKHLNK